MVNTESMTKLRKLEEEIVDEIARVAYLQTEYEALLESKRTPLSRQMLKIEIEEMAVVIEAACDAHMRRDDADMTKLLDRLKNFTKKSVVP